MAKSNKILTFTYNKSRSKLLKNLLDKEFPAINYNITPSQKNTNHFKLKMPNDPYVFFWFGWEWGKEMQKRGQIKK